MQDAHVDLIELLLRVCNTNSSWDIENLLDMRRLFDVIVYVMDVWDRWERDSQEHVPRPHPKINMRRHLECLMSGFHSQFVRSHSHQYLNIYFKLLIRVSSVFVEICLRTSTWEMNNDVRRQSLVFLGVRRRGKTWKPTKKVLFRTNLSSRRHLNQKHMIRRRKLI